MVKFSRRNVTLIPLAICIIISTASFAGGYSLAGYDGIARWIIAFGVLSLAALIFKWRRFFGLAVLFAVALASFGIWFKFTPGWMFSGAVFAFFAWDLIEFQARMKLLPPREDVSGRTRRHLIRIIFLAVSGMGLAFLLGWFRG